MFSVHRPHAPSALRPAVFRPSVWGETDTTMERGRWGVFFAGRSNSTSRHPHQVDRVAIHASLLSIIADAVGMHSGVATAADGGGWPDGWLAAKGLRRGAAVVVSCGFGPRKRQALSRRATTLHATPTSHRRSNPPASRAGGASCFSIEETRGSTRATRER